jgi:hypothetical protein
MKTISVVILSILPLYACGASRATGPAQTAPATSQQAPNGAQPEGGGMMGHGMTHSGGKGQAMVDKCPMAVPGTTVRSEEVEGGATIGAARLAGKCFGVVRKPKADERVPLACAKRQVVDRGGLPRCRPFGLRSD